MREKVDNEGFRIVLLAREDGAHGVDATVSGPVSENVEPQWLVCRCMLVQMLDGVRPSPLLVVPQHAQCAFAEEFIAQKVT